MRRRTILLGGIALIVLGTLVFGSQASRSGAVIKSAPITSRPAAATQGSAQTLHVSIAGMSFVPPTLKAKKGDTIVWQNKDLVPHTVSGRSFDSKAIAPGASWSYVTKAQGEFSYACDFHPEMTGALTVE